MRFRRIRGARRGMRPAAPALALVLSVASPAVAASVSGYARCDALTAAPGARGDAYRCYLEVARGDGSFAEAATRLRRFLTPADPDPHAPRWLAQVEADQGHDAARELFERAARRFDAAGRAAEEVDTRAAAALFLLQRGALDEAHRQLGLARAAALSLDSPVARLRLEIAEAQHQIATGDHGGARRRLDGIEQTVFADGPAELRILWLEADGANAWYLADFERSQRSYRRAAALSRDVGDVYSEAHARTNLLLLADAPDSTERKLALAEAALETALAGGNRRVAGRAYAWVASLMPRKEIDEGIRHGEQALAISRSAGDPAGVQMALRGLASILGEGDPERALELLDEAIVAARRSGDRSQEARNRIIRSRLLWQTGPRDRAIEASLEALDAIEATRELQPDSEARARRFSAWFLAYADLVDHLVAGAPADEEPAPEALALAFRVTERYRARELLDQLDAASATPSLGSEGGPRAAWTGSLAEISRLQRQLVDQGLTEAARSRLLDRLRATERDEARLRAELAGQQAAFGAVRVPYLPAPGEVQSALGEDQALIAWWLQFAQRGTSLAFVATRDNFQICRLPGSEVLEAAVSLYLGLVGRGDELERSAAGRLHELLLDCPLRRLPEHVRRLVIVPSWSLNRLPIHALRDAPQAELVGTSFEVAVVPSASVWLRLRDSPPPARGAALVLADPVLTPSRSAPPAAEAVIRSFALERARELGALPRARREGRTAARHAGRGSVLLLGEEATERAVKQRDLDRFSILHFAAHALTDDRHPDRSAIVLAPGADGDDGLLQVREIVDLGLRGQLVVLSACRSASGLQVGGEGVLGLARSFFVAGARAVVGSLWPLADDDAEALFREFYRALGDGESVASALGRARRERALAGAPPAAWAGLVVLGDGDMVPIPGGRPQRHPGTRLAALLGVAALIALPALVFRLRPRR